MKYRTLTALTACLFVGVAGADDVYNSGSDSSAGMSSTGTSRSAVSAFDRLDHNRDGVVSKDEARQHSWISRREFRQYDKDGDGQLTRVEIDSGGSLSPNDPSAGDSGSASSGASTP